MNILKYKITGNESSLQLVANTGKKSIPRCIPVEEGRRIIDLRKGGATIRQIWIALRAQGRYGEEDILDHIEGWRRDEGFRAGLKLAAASRPPQPPTPAPIMRRLAA
jgi:hypothetical protein